MLVAAGDFSTPKIHKTCCRKYAFQKLKSHYDLLILIECNQ